MFRAMRLTRAITLLAAGAATAWLLDRRQMLPSRRPPALEWPPEARPQTSDFRHQTSGVEPEAEVDEVEEVEEVEEPEIQSPEPGFVPSEQPTVEQPHVDPHAESADVTAVVDDLILPIGDQAIVDAEVVEEPASPGPPSEEEIAESVRDELGRHPDISAGDVSVEARDGLLYLRGEIDSPRLIRELDERVRELAGVERVRNLLHLPGTPPPD